MRGKNFGCGPHHETWQTIIPLFVLISSEVKWRGFLGRVYNPSTLLTTYVEKHPSF
jgi:hypothetical protein